MHPSKVRFGELRGELRLPLDEIARILRRPFGTVQAWASASRPEMIPPADVLAELEAAVVDQAIRRCRAAGMEIFRRKAA